MNASGTTRLILFVLPLCVLTSCTETPEEKLARHFERGMSYLEREQYAEATIEFRNVVKLDPDNADGHYRLALAYLKLGGLRNVQIGLRELVKTVELDPGNQDAQLKLGQLYLLGNEPAKAREHADIILANEPADPGGLLLRGRSLLAQHEYAQGVGALKKAIDLNPSNMSLYLLLARAHAQMKDYVAAEEVLHDALGVDPASILARMALGDLRLLQGRMDEAEKEYRDVMERAPDTMEAYLKLGGLYQRTRQWAKAEEIYASLATKHADRPEPHLILGNFYRLVGQQEKALASYQRATQVAPSSATARARLAEQYLDTGRLDEAEVVVVAILRENDTDLLGRLLDARLYLARGDHARAIDLLQRVIKDDPRFAEAHQFLGIAFAAQNETLRAREELSEAARLAPNSTEVRTTLAAVHLAEGSFDLALKEARAAIRLNPLNVKAAIIAGDAHIRKGDRAKANRIFEAILKAIPREPSIHYRLGLIARAEKKEARALAHFEEALEDNPNLIEPLAQIASIKVAQGDSVQARERVARQLEHAPNNPLIHNMLGKLWMTRLNAEKAEAEFKKAIALNEALPVSYLNLAALYLRTNKVDQAIQEYEAALTKNPKLVPAHMVLGRIYEQRRDYDRARTHYEEALKSKPKFAPAANNLAWLLSEHDGNIDLAMHYAHMGREQLPEDPHIADTLGWIYYKKKAYRKAVALLKEAADKLADNPIVLYHYGMALYKSGHREAAKTMLESSIRLHESFPGADEARTTLASL